MNKTIKIERDGKIQVVMVRQMAHDKQIVVGKKFKYGSGRAWIVLEVAA
jgi:hypothetical protein